MSSHRVQKLDLRKGQNPGCKKCQNRDERKEFHENALCKEVISTMDGLPVRCVGGWAYDKIYRLAQYFGIFAQGMKGKWSSLNYIEICSGPGRCVIYENGAEIDGTSLAIINHRKFGCIGKALFVDVNTEVVDVLNKRIEALGASSKAKAVVGDYQNVSSILTEIRKLPANNLNLLFVDPTECNVPFHAIQSIILTLGQVDLIVNVSIGTDVSRNVRRAILEPGLAKTKGKYEAFLGSPGFLSQDSVIEAAKKEQSNALRKLFADAYQSKLVDLGYSHFDARLIRHYYYLLFASKHPKGLEFWNKACMYAPSGQKELSLEF